LARQVYTENISSFHKHTWKPVRTRTVIIVGSNTIN